MSEDVQPEDLEITGDQKAVLELFCDDLTETEIAVRLEVSRSAVLKRFKTALKTLGVTEMLRRYGHIRVREKVKTQRINNPQDINDEPHFVLAGRAKQRKADADELRKAQKRKEGQMVGRHVTAQSEIDIIESGDVEAAVLKLLSLAKQSGIATTVLDALGARIHRGVTHVEMLPENYKDEDLKAELHKKIRLVIGHIDAATVGGAKLTDLSAMFKTLQEQVQLLEGKPTAILSIEDKNSLSDIAAKMQAEMKRREKTIDGSCEEVSDEEEGG